MSKSNKEISEVGGDGVGNAAIDDDDQTIGGGGGVHKNDYQKEDEQKEGSGVYGCMCTENIRNAKKVVLVPIAKAKKQLYHRRNKNRIKLALSSSSTPDSAANGNGNGSFPGNSFKGFGLCLRQPDTLESAGKSPCSDPNDPSFSCEMLKLLIEKNDFYSKECNPHLDIRNHG
ncbi:hypothetical protein OWV82_009440 [Melia azedarach]|uniref:Uncharacterized protein n=1 Tax=Melia azedarach TaxID=155640 RepID=A0ACC1YDD3_MELAZ|nr:hypothetical protein OWV82_009440 [Melia azedarach]